VRAARRIFIPSDCCATKSECCQGGGAREQIERQHIAIANETAQQKTFTKASRKRLFDAVQER
jgi:hypothetical protein